MGSGIVIFTPIRGLIEQCLHITLHATNNVAEYKALLLALYQLITLGANKVLIHNDSRLVVNQVNDKFMAKEEKMKLYMQEVKKTRAIFETFEIKKIQ